MSTFTEKYRQLLTRVCKQFYGHEDLSKAFFYVPYCDLVVSKKIEIEMEKRMYQAPDGEMTFFFSDAKQDFIDSLEFAGDWCNVRRILEDFSYKVIEDPIDN